MTSAAGTSGRKKLALALEYPLMQQGGTEILVRELVKRLSERWDILLVSGDASPKDLPPEYAACLCGHLSWQPTPGSRAKAQALAQAMAQHGVDLAHFHFGGTFEWRSNRFWQCPAYHLARRGVPCVSTNHLAVPWLACGVRPDRPRWQKHLYQLAAIASRSLLYRQLHWEVCVSQHDRRRVARMFPFFDDKIIQRYHALLRADEPAPNLQEREPVVLCAGNIGGRKGQQFLVEAFAQIAQRHPRWRLELIGRTAVPADMERIEKCIRQNGLEARIRVIEPLKHPELMARLQRPAIFAMPSLEEGLGLSLQEALFYGCVGLGTRVGGIPELIDDGQNGLLVPPGDVPALSAALDRLMSNPQLLESLRRQARPSILRKGMTAEAMLENYQTLYEQVLE